MAKHKYASGSEISEIVSKPLTTEESQTSSPTNNKEVDKYSSSKIPHPDDKPQYISYRVGKLHLQCNRCGNDEIIDSEVDSTNPPVWFLHPSKEQNIHFKCGRCGNTLKLYWTENVEKSMEKLKEDKEKENDSKKENVK